LNSPWGRGLAGSTGEGRDPPGRFCCQKRRHVGAVSKKRPTIHLSARRVRGTVYHAFLVQRPAPCWRIRRHQARVLLRCGGVNRKTRNRTMCCSQTLFQCASAEPGVAMSATQPAVEPEEMGTATSPASATEIHIIRPRTGASNACIRACRAISPDGRQRGGGPCSGWSAPNARRAEADRQRPPTRRCGPHGYQ